MMSIPPDVSRENFRIDGDLQIEGSLLPSEGSAFDLGSDARRFRDLYLGDPITGYVPTIHFGDQTLTANDILAIKYLATEDVLLPGNVSFYTDLFDTPTTLHGYGITDAATFAQGERADSVYTSVLTTSGLWDSTHTTVLATSSVYTSVLDTSANWNSTHTSVNTTSSTWSDVYTSVGANSSRWEAVYNNISDNTSQFLNIKTAGNIETDGVLRGPEVFYIDPAGHDDNTGKVVISGDLQVDGVTTTVNSSTLSIVDKLIEISKGSSTGAEADGSGLHVQGADATWVYTDASSSWDSNKNIKIISTGPELTLHHVPTNRFSKLGHDGNGLFFKVSSNNDTTRFMNAGNGTNLLINHNTHRVGINTTTPSVTLHVNSTDAIKIPKGTTTERPTATSASSQGYIRYNTTTNQFEGFGAGNNWGSLGGVMDVDQDTYISPETTPGADDDMLRFFTGGGERVRVDAGGNVGIGTTSPAAPLHVFGQTNNLGGLMIAAAGTTIDSFRFWIDSTATAHINRGDSIAMSITNTRNVGIGTTNPGAKLELADANNKSVVMRFRHQSFNGAYGALTELKSIGSNLTYGTDFTISNRDLNGNFQERLRVDYTGNVGIGTTNPGAQLQVQNSGGTNSYGLQILGNNTDKNRIGGILDTHIPATNRSAGALALHNSNTTTEIFFSAHPDSNNYINNGGNVGIGTMDPDYSTPVGHATGSMFGLRNTLSSSFSLFRDDTSIVASNAIGGMFFYGNGSTNPSAPVSPKELAGIDCIADADHSDDSHKSQLRFSTNDGDALTRKMVIDSDGNVGIGIENPDSELTIGGDNNPEIKLISAFNNELADASIRINEAGSVGINADPSNNSTTYATNFHITVDGSEHMRINSAGNMGIGTTNPAAKLEVNAVHNLHMRVGSLAPEISPIVRLQGQSSLEQNWYADIQLDAEDGIFTMFAPNTVGPTVKALNIIKGGNVGIGTTGPTGPEVKLEVNGGADGSVVFAGRSDGGNGNNRRFNLIAYADGGGANYGGGLKIQSRDSVNVFHDRITVQSDGNVGIGTGAYFDELLHIEKSTGTTLVKTEVASNSIVGFEIAKTGATTQSWRIVDGQTLNGVLEFYDLTNTTTRMAIMGNGNVGIGESNPGSILDIHDSTSAATTLTLGRSGEVPTIKAGGANTDLRLEAVGPGGWLDFRTDNSTKMRVMPSGRVGIGSVNPDACLDVPIPTAGSKITKFGNDITSHYVVTGQASHTLTFACDSYFQAEVVITAHQSNSGNSNNIYIRGIWSNNYTNHEWNELENVGSMTNSALIITNTHNGGDEQNGKLTIQHNYTSGSFEKMTVRITEFYGISHTYTLT